MSLRQLVLSNLYGSLPWISPCSKPGLSVFVYHEITDTPSAFASEYGLNTPPSLFREQIKWIMEKYHVVHPRMLLQQEELPKGAALITFDDGFLGSFQNGLTILEDFQCPSLFFLNMGHILEQTPLISALFCWLAKDDVFNAKLKEFGVEQPAYLNASPTILKKMSIDSCDSDALEYQGAFADMDTLGKWSESEFVAYGNHFFRHWNAAALSAVELAEQYVKNEDCLKQFANYLPMVAFTNGQPESCFTNPDITNLEKLGALKIFPASGRYNRKPADLVLDRISMGPWCATPQDLEFGLRHSLVKSVVKHAYWETRVVQ